MSITSFYLKCRAAKHPIDKVLHGILGILVYLINLGVISLTLKLSGLGIPSYLNKGISIRLSFVFSVIILILIEAIQFDVLYDNYDFEDGIFDFLAGLAGIIATAIWFIV